MKIFLVKSDLFKFLLKSRCWEPLRVSTLKEFSRNYSFLQHKKKKKKKNQKRLYSRRANNDYNILIGCQNFFTPIYISIPSIESIGSIVTDKRRKTSRWIVGPKNPTITGIISIEEQTKLSTALRCITSWKRVLILELGTKASVKKAGHTGIHTRL